MTARSEGIRLNDRFTLPPWAAEGHAVSAPRPHRFDIQGLNFHLTVPPHLLKPVVAPGVPTSPPLFPGRIQADKGVNLFSSFTGQFRTIFVTVFGSKGSLSGPIFECLAGFNVVSGWMNVQNGLKETQKTDRIRDTTGKRIAWLKTVRGAISTAAGVAFLGAFSCSTAAYLTAAKVAVTVEKFFIKLGIAFFNMNSGCGAAASLIQLNEHRQVLRESTQENPGKLISVTPQEREDIARDLTADTKYLSLTPQEKNDKVSEKEAQLLERKKASAKRVLGDKFLEMVRNGEDEKAAAAIAAAGKGGLAATLLSTANSLTGLALTVYGYLVTTPVSVPISMFFVAKAVVRIAQDAREAFRELRKAPPPLHNQ